MGNCKANHPSAWALLVSLWFYQISFGWNCETVQRVLNRFCLKNKKNIQGYFGCIKPDGVGSGDTTLEENQDTVIIKILKKMYAL